MRLKVWLLVVMLAAITGAGEEPRQWKDKKGNAIEAAFVKEENGLVTLRRKDGVTVQAKLDALCEDDCAYVRDLTYVPQTIAVTFVRERSGPRYVESGISKPATVRDTVVIQLAEQGGDAKPEFKGDASWKIESVDAVGKRISPLRGDVREDLTTEGKFVFLSYRVKNDSLAPLDVPSPALYDGQGRKFSQAERGLAQNYIPAGALFAGADPLQPGFSKLFSAFYELPDDAVPVAVEVFPSTVRPFMFRQPLRGDEPVRGKKIALSESAAAANSADRADEPPAAADGKASLFMRCTRVGQSGDSGGLWYFDRSKKRSLAYGVEMRVLGEQQKKVKLKAFFIGEASGNRDLVVDTKEAEVTLEPGKIARTTLQSGEIEEQSYYYSTTSRERTRGAKLKGVIIQACVGSELVSSWVSLSQWKKFADLPDVVKVMGELKKDESGF